MKLSFKRKFFDFKYIRRERRRALILACILFWSILAYYTYTTYFMGSMIVEGRSMSPTLKDGDRHIFHRWVYFFNEPKRGDMVVIQDPIDLVLSVKRVIALPGEKLEIRDGDVFVNDAKLDEPYLADKSFTSKGKLTNTNYKVSKDHYFVMGDNRRESRDSRYVGAVSKKDIEGKLFSK